MYFWSSGIWKQNCTRVIRLSLSSSTSRLIEILGPCRNSCWGCVCWSHVTWWGGVCDNKVCCMASWRDKNTHTHTRTNSRTHAPTVWIHLDERGGNHTPPLVSVSLLQSVVSEPHSQLLAGAFRISFGPSLGWARKGVRVVRANDRGTSKDVMSVTQRSGSFSVGPKGHSHTSLFIYLFIYWIVYNLVKCW